MINKENVLILVVDDDIELCNMLVDFVKSKGYNAEKATGAKEAIKIIKDKRVYLVLLDIKMPRVDGMEVLHIVKEKQPLAEVIMMTGYATIEDAIISMRNGAYDFIIKPLNLDEVDVSITGALERRQGAIENRNYVKNLERKVRNTSSELVRKRDEIKKIKEEE
ncbi:MAG: response regulator [Candidatus Omnitrophota bacterium]